MFSFGINNYRSFLNESFKFSRINILIGENSSGKSSLLKFLLAIKQSFDNPLQSNLTLKGDYTDLGNYEEAVYYHNTKKNITFSFEFGADYFNFFINFMIERDEEAEVDSKIIKKHIDKILTTLKNCSSSKTIISFTLSESLDEHSSTNILIENNVLGRLSITPKKDKKSVAQAYGRCDIHLNFGKIEAIVPAFYTKEAFLTLILGELEEECKKLFGRTGEAFFIKIAFLIVTQNFIKNIFNDIRYVNPIKTKPERFFFQEDAKAEYKLIDLEKFINVLSNKKLKEKDKKDRIDLMNKHLKKFGIADEIRLINHEKLPVLGLEIKTKDLWSNILDVGYGVSLQLPIFFQAILSEHYTVNGETLLIEQPEVHLHPSLQARFIESLISIGTKNVYFIETHSEHIIRKLQSLIKNKDYNLKTEDVSIHYFKRTSKKFEITRHDITDSGSLNPQFPKGFYDVSYSLVKELL